MCREKRVSLFTGLLRNIYSTNRL